MKQNAMTSQMFGITFCLWEVSSRSLMPLLPEATRRFYPFTQTQDPPAEKKPPMSRVGYPDFIGFFFKREWKRSESFD